MLADEQLRRVRSGIAVFLSDPFNPTVSGASWEGIFAYGVEGAVSGTGGVAGAKGSKTLFDVVKDSTGWSCKTLLMLSADPRDLEYEFVIKRADVLRKHNLQMDDPYELAEHVIQDRNDEYARSAKNQAITDPRVGLLLRNRAQTDFAYWEEEYGTFDVDEYSWDWGSDKKISVVGRQDDGFIKFRWYRSGAQLFERFRVPPDAQIFSVEWESWTPDELYALLYGP